MSIAKKISLDAIVHEIGAFPICVIKREDTEKKYLSKQQFFQKFLSLESD